MHCIQSSVLVVVCLLSVYGSAVQASGFHLDVSQRVIHIHKNDTATIICRAMDSSGSVPLKICQFHHPTLGTLDLSDGPLTPVHPNYTYYGNGLLKGDCGMKLGGNDVNNVWKHMGCRAQAVIGGPWQYADVLVNVDGHRDSVTYSLSPEEAIVNVGDNISISGVADEKVYSCQFWLPTEEYVRFKTKYSVVKGYQYFGKGLNNKTCGITMTNVSVGLNGLVVGWVHNIDTDSYYRNMMSLIVATAPEPPKLSLNNPPAVYKPGELLQATCIVANSRPVSNITWLLGDSVVRNDSVDESHVNIEDNWKWKYDNHSITQHLNLTLKQEDAGKMLTCRAGHFALPEGVATAGIRITFEAIEPTSEGLHLHNHSTVFTVGEVLEATCVVPNISGLSRVDLLLGDTVLREETFDDSVLKGSSNVQTIIKHVKKTLTNEDDGKQLTCRFSQMGSLNIVTYSRICITVETTSERLSLHNNSTVFKVGEVIQAKCVVPNSCAVSNVTWLLGDTVLRFEQLYFVQQTRQSNIRSFTLSLNRTLRSEDDGKQLTCQFSFRNTPRTVTSSSICISVETTYERLSLHNNSTVFKVGEVLQATCVVPNSCAVSNVTWLLGDTVLRQDAIDDSELREKNNTKTITQHVKKTLTMEDDGKQLTCRFARLGSPHIVTSSSICISVEHGWFAQYWLLILSMLLLISALAFFCVIKRRRCSGNPVKGLLDSEQEISGLSEQDDYNISHLLPTAIYRPNKRNSETNGDKDDTYGPHYTQEECAHISAIAQPPLSSEEEEESNRCRGRPISPVKSEEIVLNAGSCDNIYFKFK